MNNLYKYSLVPICILFICTIPLLADEAKFAASRSHRIYNRSKITVTYTLTKGGGSSFKPRRINIWAYWLFTNSKKLDQERYTTAQAWSSIIRSISEILFFRRLLFLRRQGYASNSLKLNITKANPRPTVDFNQPKILMTSIKLLFIKLILTNSIYVKWNGYSYIFPIICRRIEYWLGFRPLKPKFWQILAFE
jgi:hypothetical protein